MDAPTVWTVLLRFAITFICALIFGVQRQRSHKPIGFGTFSFVSVGACALSIVSVTVIKPGDTPLPLLGAIVSGIGFLGAGALIRTSDKIFGFTTAASIWLFAVFGLSVGVGEYLVGLLIYFIVWVVIYIDHHLEKRGIGSYQRKIHIHTNKLINHHEIEDIFLLYSKKFKLISLEIDKKNAKLMFEYLIEGTKETINKIPRKLYEKEWFESFKVE